MVRSLGSFIVGILKKIYWLLPSLLLDPFDMFQRWCGVNYAPPVWLFWLLLGLGLFIAAFLTYNDVKRKLDERGEEFYFEPTGASVTTKEGSVLLQICFTAKPKVVVDKLALDIGGMHFSPAEWKPIVVSPQYTDIWTFDLLGKVKQNEMHKGKLIAVANGKEYKSREFDVPT